MMDGASVLNAAMNYFTIAHSMVKRQMKVNLEFGS